jgi:hypothetical protein
VNQGGIGGYEENAREKQNRQYTGKKHQLPLKPSHTDGKHQSPLLPINQQSEKHRGFGEDIGQLSLRVYVSYLNVSIFYMIS